MIREIVRPTRDKMVIDISDEYINKEVEILIFANSETKRVKLENREFDKIIGKKVKPKIQYRLKMEDEVNSDIF